MTAFLLTQDRSFFSNLPILLISIIQCTSVFGNSSGRIYEKWVGDQKIGINSIIIKLIHVFSYTFHYVSGNYELSHVWEPDPASPSAQTTREIPPVFLTRGRLPTGRVEQSWGNKSLQHQVASITVSGDDLR